MAAPAVAPAPAAAPAAAAVPPGGTALATTAPRRRVAAFRERSGGARGRELPLRAVRRAELVGEDTLRVWHGERAAAADECLTLRLHDRAQAVMWHESLSRLAAANDAGRASRLEPPPAIAAPPPRVEPSAPVPLEAPVARLAEDRAADEYARRACRRRRRQRRRPRRRRRRRGERRRRAAEEAAVVAAAEAAAAAAAAASAATVVQRVQRGRFGRAVGAALRALAKSRGRRVLTCTADLDLNLDLDLEATPAPAPAPAPAAKGGAGGPQPAAAGELCARAVIGARRPRGGGAAPRRRRPDRDRARLPPRAARGRRRDPDDGGGGAGARARAVDAVASLRPLDRGQAELETK